MHFSLFTVYCVSEVLPKIAINRHAVEISHIVNVNVKHRLIINPVLDIVFINDKDLVAGALRNIFQFRFGHPPLTATSLHKNFRIGLLENRQFVIEVSRTDNRATTLLSRDIDVAHFRLYLPGRERGRNQKSKNYKQHKFYAFHDGPPL